MFKFVAVVLSLFAFVGVMAENENKVFEHPYPRSLMAIDTYKGTEKGQFKGDLIAILDDGSAWKVHPTEQNKFKDWQINEKIYVNVRESWYWFKREHKFELINAQRKESVKVMLVAMPTQPLTVTKLKITYLRKSSRPLIYTKPDGERLAVWSNIEKYMHEVELSDGSLWLIVSFGVQGIKEGTILYPGANLKDNKLKYFLSFGTELKNESIHFIEKVN